MHPAQLCGGLQTIFFLLSVLVALKKKKGKKKEQPPEHIYDSVSLPPSALPSLSGATNLDYDEVATTNCSDTQFEFTKNTAYGSFKPPAD